LCSADGGTMLWLTLIASRQRLSLGVGTGLVLPAVL
jgi:hypothetical protein